MTPLRRSAKGFSSHSNRVQSGFSLLEVILALAILAGAMVVIGELVRMGTENARSSVDLTQAELIADSIWAEIQSGERTPDSATATYEFQASDETNRWQYSIDSVATEQEGLLLVQVAVARGAGDGSAAAEFALTGWIRDPNWQPPAAVQPATGTGGTAP